MNQEDNIREDNREANDEGLTNNELDKRADSEQLRTEQDRNRIRIQKKQKRMRHAMIERIGAAVIVFSVLTIAVVGIRNGLFSSKEKQATNQESQQEPQQSGESSEGLTGQETDNQDELQNEPESESQIEPNAEEAANIEELVRQADILELGYNQDAAIDLIKSYPDYEKSTIMMEALERYEQSKAALVIYEDIMTTTHIFFHSLIVDPTRAFDGDERQDGYNQYMATVTEFEAVIQQMYDNGYVLISIKDMVARVTLEDGTVRFEMGEIMLPPGKKPFILSLDDVSYHDSMNMDGFASKIILEEDGSPTSEMILADGTITTGNFDVVPCLEAFIEEHPDFSYKGARGILAVTGHNGVMGYRTDSSYSEEDWYAEEYEEAVKVAQGLKDGGWEFASHSYAHIDMVRASLAEMQWDTEKWKAEVEPIVGETDIFVYPFGSDIGDWRVYEGEKYEYLMSQNYRYFCNVDSAISWIQLQDDYVRQGRRNIDGIRMYYDMIDDSIDLLSDLFDVNLVFDESRPVPVPR